MRHITVLRNHQFSPAPASAIGRPKVTAKEQRLRQGMVPI